MPDLCSDDSHAVLGLRERIGRGSICQCLSDTVEWALVPASDLLTVQKLKIIGALRPLLARPIGTWANLSRSLRLEGRKALNAGPVRV